MAAASGEFGCSSAPMAANGSIRAHSDWGILDICLLLCETTYGIERTTRKPDVVHSGLAGCEDTQPEAVIMNSMSAAAPKPWARMARRFGAVLHQGTHVFQRAAHDLSRG